MKTGRQQLLLRGGPEIAGHIAKACDDIDPEISKAAADLIRSLKRRKAWQDALCDALIHEDCHRARDAVLELGHIPEDTAKRAAFLFVTEQWERYEALDFDHRILRAFYESADAAARHRIVEKLRVAGRTDFLAVVVGGDRRSRADELTLGESELLVQTLATNREWPRLWSTVFDLPFYWSFRAMKRLAQSGWKPEDGENREVFEELESLLSEQMVDSEERMQELLPPAEPRAHARVPGRVNDLAFCPDRPVIAIGTGQRKLVLWNFQQAERETVLDGFDHSIGLVAYAGNGALLCAECTNARAECAIHRWLDGERQLLGKHKGSVTALEPAGESLMLTAGRDQRAVVWDIAIGRQIVERQFDFWARSACTATNGQVAALLHKDATIVTFPDLAEKSFKKSPYWVRTARLDGVARCAAFATDGASLLIGTGSEVVALDLDEERYNPEVSVIASHAGLVQGIKFLPERDVVVTSGSDGTLNFLSWPKRSIIDSFKVAFATQYLSPDGRAMAFTNSDGSVTVWSMRDPSRPVAVAAGSDSDLQIISRPHLLSKKEIKTTDDRLTSMHISPDGSFMALGHSDGSISLWDLRLLGVPMLVNQPFAQATPDHLAGVSMAMEHAGDNEGLKRTLQFMECILRFRFRHDIDIDDVPIIQAGEFDIEVEG